MIDLVNHVLDHAPSNVRGAERLLLVAIAEDMRAPGVPRDIPVDDLARRLGVPARQVREVAERLAGRGIEVRVPLGKDRHGNKLYAVPGMSPRWVVPHLAIPDHCGCPNCSKTSQNREGAAKTAPANPLDTKPQVTEGAVFTAPPNVGAVNTASGAVNTAPGAVNTAPTPCRSRKTHSGRGHHDTGGTTHTGESVRDQQELNHLSADDPRWLELRTTYPKREGAAQARPILAQMLAEGVDFNLILCGLKAYTGQKNAEGKELRWWPNLATWLRDRRWEDETGASPASTAARPAAIPRAERCDRHWTTRAADCHLCAEENTARSAA